MKMNKKKLLLFGLLPLLVIGIASAALVGFFGKITQSVDVEQAVALSGTGCSSSECTDSFVMSGGETIISETYAITSMTSVDGEVQFVTDCSAIESENSCDELITTEMVELSVTGFTGGDEFERDHYKTTDYESTTSLDELDTVTYSFKVTENSGSNQLAPYVVIVGQGIGPYNVAVYLIPDGETYDTNTEYTRTIDENSLFHIPGDNDCANQNPATATCTLDYIKTNFDAPLSKIRLAVGAWGDPLNFKALVGISKINGEQAVHKSLTIGAEETMNFVTMNNLPFGSIPGDYTITTSVEPVTT